jgi:hypothetical protein
MLGFFKLGLYSLPFAVNGLKAVLNTGQEGCTCGELLKSSCHIKVLWVLRTIPDCPGDIGMKGRRRYKGVAYTNRQGWLPRR